MRRFRRFCGARLIMVVLLAFACPPTVAEAAGTTTTSAKLGAGSSAVSPCGSLSAVTSSWTVSAGKVTAVTVGSIPAACNGATAAVTLVDSSSASVGAQSGVTVAAGSATFSSLSPTPASTTVAGIHVAIVGP
jgi:hypothetical protein